MSVLSLRLSVCSVFCLIVTVGGGPGLSIRRKYKDNLSRLMSKTASARKRRWDSLIEVAKSGKVGRFISQSRSEDSVCGEQRSPNSEDTDSNASAAEGKALSAWKKKRANFSQTRYHPNESSSVDIEEKCEKKILKRASSVPVQGRSESPEMTVSRTVEPSAPASTTPPSTAATTACTTSATSVATTTSNAKSADDFKDRNGMIMPSLPPGIQPVSGHNIATGWL